MQFELDPLPYPKDALQPHISARTLTVHYEKHHQGYLNKLQKAIQDTAEAEKDLETIIKLTDDQKVFNNAAQVWNHTFFWNSMSPSGGGEPPAPLKKELEQHFGSVDNFKSEFAAAANGQFGSGWAWLVRTKDGRLEVCNTLNANTPLVGADTPLCTLDVWEHAYYLDWQNDRASFVDSYLQHLVNWDFIGANLERAS